MVNRFLVTTALEETWPENLETPTLLLGEWCRLYSRKEYWSQLNAKILPYHWDDRNKLYLDYKYIQVFYEKILKSLADELNNIHKVDHSLRYWRILLGSWLGYFIQMLFDRWSSIDQALNLYSIDETIILDFPSDSFVSQGMFDFSNYYTSDEWNHYIYGKILESKSTVSIKYYSTDPFQLNVNTSNISIKRLLVKLLEYYSSFFSRNDKYFFMETYLPHKTQLELEIKLGQLPKFWRNIIAPNIFPNKIKRDWEIELNPSSEFEAIAIKLITKMLPILYFEGYHSLVKFASKLPWPNNPKIIWTSNACNNDDVFNIYAAEKLESGAKLIIGQHGGNYGIGKWYFNEKHEIAISDKYLTWGWRDPKETKVVPIGQLKNKKPFGVDHNLKKGLLMVCLTVPRYSYHMYSIIVSRQYLDYLEDQFLFVNALPNYIKSNLTVRLLKNDFGWDQKMRWYDYSPKIKLDSGEKNIDELIIKSRIYVSTYNASTFLESLTMNIPTVIFWNPNHWELRKFSKPYFNELIKVKIFHETPESAAEHIVSIWDNVDKWWNDSLTKKAVKNFTEIFSKIDPNLVNSLYKEIRTV